MVVPPFAASVAPGRMPRQKASRFALFDRFVYVVLRTHYSVGPLRLSFFVPSESRRGGVPGGRFCVAASGPGSVRSELAGSGTGVCVMERDVIVSNAHGAERSDARKCLLHARGTRSPAAWTIHYSASRKSNTNAFTVSGAWINKPCPAPSIGSNVRVGIRERTSSILCCVISASAVPHTRSI